jgi:hypothetical protein
VEPLELGRDEEDEGVDEEDEDNPPDVAFVPKPVRQLVLYCGAD